MAPPPLPGEPDRSAPEPPLADGFQGEAFEFAHDPQIVTDAQGLVTSANHAAAALLRCPKEFLIDKPLGLFIAQSRSRFYAALAALARGAEIEVFDTVFGRGGEDRREVFVVATRDPRSATGGRAGVFFHWRMTDMTARRRAEAEREGLMRRLVTAQEDERRRVARELHDSVGQLLTGLLLAAKAVMADADLPPPATDRLAEVVRLADAVGKEVHAIAVRLRPTALDDLGLEAALGTLVREWSRWTGIQSEFEASGLPPGRLPTDVESTVYRVVQEALTNVARHAGATTVGVALSRRGGELLVAVEDDGTGFDHERGGHGRLGLVGMRERLGLVGGVLQIESTPGAGTTVYARIPLGAPAARAAPPGG